MSKNSPFDLDAKAKAIKGGEDILDNLPTDKNVKSENILDKLKVNLNNSVNTTKKESSNSSTVSNNSHTSTSLSETYSKEQIQEMLQGFKDIPLSEINTIKRNSRMRYIRTNGKFLAGGLFQAAYVDKKTNIKRILLSNGFQGNNEKKWTVKIQDIGKLFIKNPELDPLQKQLVENAIEQPIELIKKLAEKMEIIRKVVLQTSDECNKLKTRLDNLEDKLIVKNIIS